MELMPIMDTLEKEVLSKVEDLMDSGIPVEYIIFDDKGIPYYIFGKIAKFKENVSILFFY